jgi:ABC-type bacteriocin/lantibiotic exporter with double-glycine peptidase domain
MKLVKQKGPSDCVLCSLAMAVKQPYTKLFSSKFREKVLTSDGCYDKLLTEAFKRAGLVEGENLKKIYTENLDRHLVNAIIWGRRALLQVPSLNYAKGSHMIYWNGRELLDPSNLQVYRFIENVRPTYVWLFKEIEDV